MESQPRERLTRQKRAITAVLDEFQEFKSAQEIYTELRNRGENVGLTTIYTQLRLMAESAEVDVFRSSAGETLYRKCGSGLHHHHLVCKKCGATIEIEGPEVENWATKVASKYGYSDITHTVEIVGICKICSQISN
ncbi:MAG: transcriptional repressor [Acidimicrobiales bacterium]|nr:transcriptional repressor [Acidimicrobiales bacterium]